MEKLGKRRRNLMIKAKMRKASLRAKHFIDIVFGCDEILREIFKYLSTLKEVNLVCKQFHRVASELHQGKDWMWIPNEETIDDVSLFQSMMNSKRVVSNVAIGESSAISPVDYYEVSDNFLMSKWYSSAIETIVGIRHAGSVKCLQFMNVDISMHSLLTLLSMCPKIRFVKLFFVSQTHSKVPSAEYKYMKETLPNISDVIMYQCGPMVDWLVKYLPQNTIKSLTMKCLKIKNLPEVLKAQASIKKLSLTTEVDRALPLDLLGPIKLTHLTLNVRNQENVSEILESQADLLYLDVSQMKISSETFQGITKLSRLQRLDINFTSVSCGSIPLISQLKALKILTVTASSNNHLEQLLSLKNFRLDKFRCTDVGCDKSLVNALEEQNS